MDKITATAKKLLKDKYANLVIGYAKSAQGKVIPFFAACPESADKLIFDDDCVQNLVAYLHKKEVKAYEKIGIVVTFPALRALMQIYAENQFKTLSITAIIQGANGVVTLSGSEQIESYIKENFDKDAGSQDAEKVSELLDKPLAERWDYWVETLSECIKCYACRSACPMCYCEKCATDCNSPQWTPTSAHVQGIVEWHIMRSMHLAGRCVNCNECARACPMDIPLNLFTKKLNDDIESQFGQVAGLSAKSDYALSTFKNEDNENFIR